MVHKEELTQAPEIKWKREHKNTQPGTQAGINTTTWNKMEKRKQNTEEGTQGRINTPETRGKKCVPVLKGLSHWILKSSHHIRRL